MRIGKQVISDSRHTQRSSEPAGSGFLVKDASAVSYCASVVIEPRMSSPPSRPSAQNNSKFHAVGKRGKSISRNSA